MKKLLLALTLVGAFAACQPPPAPAPAPETGEQCEARLDSIDAEWRVHMPFECDDHPDPEA